MTTPPPSDRSRIHPYVATAPQPTLRIGGLTAVITTVRFVWHGARCHWCRQSVALWSDDGTIDAGLHLEPSARRRPRRARWFQTYRPATAPEIPPTCPHPGCPGPATPQAGVSAVPARWLHGVWTLTTGPFTVGHDMSEHCPLPAHPDTYRLLDQAYTRLRRAHPDLAAAADALERERLERAHRTP